MKGDHLSQGYMIDSSSLFTLFFLGSQENVKSVFRESYILDLTGYEIGSILAKGKDGHIKGLEKDIVMDLTVEIERVLSRIKVVRLEPSHVSKIMEIAYSSGLTFYDASYLFYSKFLGIGLLTDDVEMYTKARKHGVKVMKVEELPN